MEKFPFSIVVHRNGDVKDSTELATVMNTYTIHTCGIVEASDKDTAFGKANRIAQNLYPAEAGYYSHHVVLGNMEPIEPENAYIVK